MMKLEAKNEKVYEVNYILPRGSELAISMESADGLGEIAKNVDGMDVFRVTEGDKANVTHLYEGYKVLKSIHKTDSGSVRITLARE